MQLCTKVDLICQPCILCKQGNQSKYFHHCGKMHHALIERVRLSEPSLNIFFESLMCRPLRDDLSTYQDGGIYAVKIYVLVCSHPSFRVTQEPVKLR